MMSNWQTRWIVTAVTRRRKLPIGLVLATCALIGALAIPTSRFFVIGLLRREPFYEGQSASYWRYRCLQFEAYKQKNERAWETGSMPPKLTSWVSTDLRGKA